MKRCPHCNRVETDATLRFCRHDGTPLVSDSSSHADQIGTARLGSGSTGPETETTILPHQTGATVNRATGPTTLLPPQPLLATTKQPARKRKGLIAVVAATLLIAIAISGYFIAKTRVPGKGKTIESVAVLPFENKSGNADSEYLSDGLAESLIYRLSQLSNLKVSPRSSAFRYKGQSIDAEKIGNELGVDAVMSGRLIQRGEDLVISVDLIDVRN